MSPMTKRLLGMTRWMILMRTIFSRQNRKNYSMVAILVTTKRPHNTYTFFCYIKKYEFQNNLYISFSIISKLISVKEIMYSIFFLVLIGQL